MLLLTGGCASLDSAGPVGAIREFCTRFETANYRVEAADGDRQSVENIVNRLEHVPDPFQKIVNDHRATVVIFDGDALDHVSSFEATEDLRNVSGVYVPSVKGIFINHHGHRPDDISVCLELHEYGHAIDHALAALPDTPYTNEAGYYVSGSDEFKQIHEEATRKTSWFTMFVMTDHEEDRREFFAESFARFYYSDRSRASMKRRLPECHEFFRKMEEYFLKKHDSRKILAGISGVTD